MSRSSTLKAFLLGCTIAFSGHAPANAETLRVIQGAPSRALQVPMNRAVVVESDRAFTELTIANPSIADISPLSERTIYVLGKEPGRTTLTLTDESGTLISNVEVQVTPDIAEFKERLTQILPGERIEVRTANNGIVMSGVVSSPAKLQSALELAERYAPERVSNLMSVGGVQQVMLKVRFAEMQRSVTKMLSSSVAIANRNFNSSGVGVTAGNGDLAFQGARAAALTGAQPSGNSLRNGSMVLGFGAGSAEVRIMLEALESKGVVRTLAEPNLTALSGQEARFLAGGEYPIPASQSDNTVTVEFKPFGVEMFFIPHVLADDRISLELRASVSSIDPQNGITVDGLNIAAFRTRLAETTVELGDGESFAIAGLLRDDFTDNAAQVPWLGDVPILGSLFRSADYNRSQSELVIIVSAHLVSPTRGETLALPTDAVPLPTERELFLHGRVLGGGNRPRYGAAAEVAKQDFSGSYGYVMD